eukprot:scaffold98182_cov55-Phaeocystis_antarctica.AAC.2
MPEALRCQPEEEWAWSAASALCWCERLRDGRQRFGGGGGGGGGKGMPSGLWASPVEGLVLPFLDSLPRVAECNKPRAATTCLLPIWQAGCNKPRAATTCLLPIWQQGVTNQELQQALVMRLWSWWGEIRAPKRKPAWYTHTRRNQ